MLPGVQEQQQVMFGHSALLCCALEVIGATSGACSQTPSGGGPHPPLDNCSGLPPPPVDPAKSTCSRLAPTEGVAPAAPSCRVLGRDSDQAITCGERNNMWCLVAVPSVGFFFFFFAKT